MAKDKAGGCFGCKHVIPHFTYKGLDMIISCAKLGLCAQVERGECDSFEPRRAKECKHGKAN